MAKAESTVSMNATPDKVMAVIADFERYPEFLPEIRGVSILSSDAGVSTVRFDLQMLMKVSYTIVLTQEGNASLTWELGESKLMKNRRKINQFWVEALESDHRSKSE